MSSETNDPDIRTAASYDLLVIGGGNAALCSAMTARESGMNVLLLESSPKEFRGGSSRHPRNLRYLHEKENEYLTGPYLEDEFYDDLIRVTKGRTNEDLARLTIRGSNDIGTWMEQHGCHFQPAMRGTLHLARTNAFFLGGGKALMNAYYAFAEHLGITIQYESEVVDMEIEDGRFVSARVKQKDSTRSIYARAVVVASGGFQANLAWLKEYWGDPADNFIVRGSPYDKGKVLKVLLCNKVKSVGDPRQCHAVAIDALPCLHKCCCIVRSCSAHTRTLSIFQLTCIAWNIRWAIHDYGVLRDAFSEAENGPYSCRFTRVSNGYRIYLCPAVNQFFRVVAAPVTDDTIHGNSAYYSSRYCGSAVYFDALRKVYPWNSSLRSPCQEC